MRRIATILFALILAGPTHAQTETPAVPDISIFDNRMQQSLRISPREVIKRMTQELFIISGTGVLNAQTAAQHRAILAAAEMAETVGRLLSLDIDFDGVLSAAEIIRTMNDQNPQSRFGRIDRAEFAVLVAEADADEDGAITWDEIRRFVVASQTDARPSARVEGRIDQLFLFDLNKDGSVDVPEIIRTVRLINPCDC